MSEDAIPVDVNGRVSQRQLYDTIQELRKENKDDLKSATEELKHAIESIRTEMVADRNTWRLHITRSDEDRLRREGRDSLAYGTIKFIDDHWRAFLTIAVFLYTLVSGLDISQFIHK